MSIWGAVKTWLVDFPGHPGTGPNEPSCTSPTVNAWQKDLSLVRALYGGFQALYAERGTYLPQHPAEDPKDYLIRAARPTFYNAFGRTVRALTGIVFTTSPEPDGVPSQILELYEDDIDNQGTAGDTFLRHTFQDGLITGLAGILVDQDTLEGEGKTRADELDAGIRPFWSLIRMDDIVSFRTVVEDGKTLLGQLVLRERRQIPFGDFGVKVVERLRVFRRIPKKPAGDSGDSLPASVTEDAYEKNDKGTWAVVRARTLPTVEEIPFAPIYTGRTDFMDASPPLVDLAYVNLLHYQMWSDLAHAAHVANVPVLFGVGLDEDEIQLGPNRAILVKSGDEHTTLRWLETTGASLGSTRSILADLEEQMAALGLGMLQRKSRAAETAEKASLDRKEQDSTLAAIVGDLENGVELALFWTAQYVGLPSGGRLSFARDFQTDPAAAGRTENQGAPQDPKEPAQPGATNNPKTTA